MHMGKPSVVISACLLGRDVRYDGTNKFDRCIGDLSTSSIRPIALCPEAGSGLGVPREPMHLEIREPGATRADNIRLITNTTGIDRTPRLMRWAQGEFARLGGQKISGAILKSRSPSCGPRGVEARRPGRLRAGKASGIFARELALAFPLIPVIDEKGMNDPVQRELFLEKAFFIHEWGSFMAPCPSFGRLVEFHERMELLLLSHSEAGCRRLREFLASKSSSTSGRMLFDIYITIAMQVLGPRRLRSLS